MPMTFNSSSGTASKNWHENDITTWAREQFGKPHSVNTACCCICSSEMDKMEKLHIYKGKNRFWSNTLPPFFLILQLVQSMSGNYFATWLCLPPQLSNLKKITPVHRKGNILTHFLKELRKTERQRKRVDTLVTIAIAGTVTLLPRN